MILRPGRKNYIPVVKHVRVRTAHAPRGIEKLRIVFAADIHADGRFDAEARDRLVSLIGAEKPDLLLLGGDYGEKDVHTEDMFARIGTLSVPMGVFAVLGNNDLQHFRYDYRRLCELARRNGIDMLVNREAVIPFGNSAIRVGGTDESYYGFPDTRGFFRDASPDDFTILLTHRPHRALLQSLEKPCAVMLCGHTHGGQGRFLGITPYSLKYECRKSLIAVSGERDVNGTKVIVTNGIGTSKIPLRINVPPEIIRLNVNAD